MWQDEFSGPRLDRKKWRAVDDPTIGRYGLGNGQSQACLDAEGGTFLVRGDRLIIVAHHAPGATYPLRDKPSGKIRKEIGHQDFKFAKVTLCGSMILPRGERAGIQLGPRVVATGRVEQGSGFGLPGHSVPDRNTVMSPQRLVRSSGRSPRVGEVGGKVSDPAFPESEGLPPRWHIL